jgi:DNA repair protein RadC
LATRGSERARALLVEILDEEPGGGALADHLLATFGSIGGVVAADRDALAAAAGMAAARRFKAIEVCLSEMLSAQLRDRPLLGNMRQLIDYLTVTASYAAVEQVRALFLNAKLELIRDELLSTGCISEAVVHTRPILKRALDLGAAGLVLVHNHPSGDPAPSGADESLTRQLSAGLSAVGVDFVDHIIVAQGDWLSFRVEGLLA